jgi:hypothetical protein
MKMPWFKRFGILYIPKTSAGWIIFIAAVAYSVYAFIDIDSRSHSVSDTLMNFVFRIFILYLVYTLIAFLTSMKKAMMAIVLFVGLTSLCQAQQTAGWEKWSWLVGEWVGEGSGQTGQGGGSFSIKPDLDGKVIVRKNHAEYPATEKSAKIVHDDLTIMYTDNPDGIHKAIYFDNEGHVIRYLITYSDNSVVLTSETQGNQPIFRLTYDLVGKETINVKFEISPDGEKFNVYTEGKCNKVK